VVGIGSGSFAITGYGIISSKTSGSDARELFIYLVMRIFRKWVVRLGGGWNCLRTVSSDGLLPELIS
jgi:hypothetical protein